MKVYYMKKNVIHILLYVAFLFTYLIILEVFGMGDSVSKFRYIVLALVAIIGFVSMFFRSISGSKSNNKLYSKNLLFIIVIFVFFLVQSYIKSRNVGRDLNSRTLIQLSLIILPALYAFSFINIFSLKTIINFMKFTCIITIIAYFCEPNHPLISFFDINNWRNVNFIKSTSFTESNICSEVFLQLFLFFYYFKNIDDASINKKSLSRFSTLTFIFTILSFKRLGTIVAILIILLQRIIDFKGKVPKIFVLIIPLFFTIATSFYIQFMEGTLFDTIDVSRFTTGRDYILSLWEKENYFSYGYGTSLLVIGRYLEMDLIQIYLELNAVSLFIFSFIFFIIAKNNVYSILIMTYAFFNMLTASSLPYSLGWVIFWITISCISSNKCENENINIKMRQQRLKRLFEKKRIKENIINVGVDV